MYMCGDHKNGENKSAKDRKGDDDMAKTSETMREAKEQHSNTDNIKDILEKGIKRYDKALEKLSKN